MSRLRYLLVVLFLILSLSCSFGRQGPTEVVTEEAPTGSATAAGEGAHAQPTMTPAPAVSSGGCSLNAAYVADVTIPDNTVVQPGASFTKVWRVRNSGTCNWEPGTQLVFVSGEPMTAIGAVPVPAVAAGSMTDISVDMTAPTTPGTYKSVWQLQSPSGQLFGNRIYVQVVVPAPPTATFTPAPPTDTPVPPTATPTAIPLLTPMTLIIPPGTLVVLPSVATLSPTSRGQVRSGGDVRTGVSNCGDTTGNEGLQAFVTYDLSGIPAGSTIVEATLQWPSYDTLGTPFADLGCMRVYLDDYGTLDAGDYTPPPVLGAVGRYCSLGEIANADSMPLSDAVNNIIHARAGSMSIQFRLQFNERETDGDGVSDAFRGQPQLVVSYYAP